jgi:hypothetical protein
VNGSDDALPLVQFVKAAPNLGRIILYGSYRVSQLLMDTINEYIPSCRIELYAEFPREWDGHYEGWQTSGPLIQGMCGFSSPQLHTLELDNLWRFDSQGVPVVTRSLEKILKCCPNLRILKCSGPISKVTESPSNSDLMLLLDTADTLPYLEEYWYIQLSVYTLDKWKSLTSWATLRVLKLSSSDQLPGFAGRIPTLRHFTMSAESDSDLDELNSFRELDAPLETISVLSLSNARIPYDFLHQYKTTLRELGLHTGRLCESAFKGADIRRLHRTCSLLERLSIHVEYSGKWPILILEEFSQFDHLTQLILDWGFNCSKYPLPDQDDALMLYHLIRGRSVNPTLRTLGLHYGDQWVAQGHTWQNKLDQVRHLCQAGSLGNLRLTRPFSTERDTEIYHKICCESRNRVLQCRPFSREYPMLSNQNDLIWFAKQLGTGSDWVTQYLLPKGLLTQHDIDSTETPTFPKLEDHINANRGQIERHKELVEDELRYWKQRREFEARYGKWVTLYDILYPANVGEGENVDR